MVSCERPHAVEGDEVAAPAQRLHEPVDGVLQVALPAELDGLLVGPDQAGLGQLAESDDVGRQQEVAAAELRAAVAELPPSQQTALALAKLEDLPLAEASARSGMSVGALKVATHRAVKALRRRLGVED